jgi:aspartate aminotransferase
MHVNQRVSRIAGSSTLALAARAKQLASSGVDVISMAVGEPDFDAPASVRAAAAAAVHGGNVRYTPVAGTLALRTAIVRHVRDTRGVEYDMGSVAVCHSCKHALSNVLLTLVEPDDEVLLFAPVWNSYDEEVRFAGGTVRHVAPRADLGPDFAALAASVGSRTRGVMLNSPSNPSGYVWTADEVRQLVEIAELHDLWILSDEIYRRLVYEGEPAASPASTSAAGRARTVIVDGASKTYAMTGYRIGFVAGPTEIVEAVERLQSQLTGCPNAISQAAYEVALGPEPPEVAEMFREFARRREVLIAGLARLGLEVARPRGAFYAFPNVAPHLDARSSEGFCEDLLESQALAVVPGSVFGRDEHVRLSYATSTEKIGGALARLGAFLEVRGR